MSNPWSFDNGSTTPLTSLTNVATGQATNVFNPFPSVTPVQQPLTQPFQFSFSAPEPLSSNAPVAAPQQLVAASAAPNPPQNFQSPLFRFGAPASSAAHSSGKGKVNHARKSQAAAAIVPLLSSVSLRMLLQNRYHRRRTAGEEFCHPNTIYESFHMGNVVDQNNDTVSIEGYMRLRCKSSEVMSYVKLQGLVNLPTRTFTLRTHPTAANAQLPEPYKRPLIYEGRLEQFAYDELTCEIRLVGNWRREKPTDDVSSATASSDESGMFVFTMEGELNMLAFEKVMGLLASDSSEKLAALGVSLYFQGRMTPNRGPPSYIALIELNINESDEASGDWSGEWKRQLLDVSKAVDLASVQPIGISGKYIGSGHFSKIEFEAPYNDDPSKVIKFNAVISTRASYGENFARSIAGTYQVEERSNANIGSSSIPVAAAMMESGTFELEQLSSRHASGVQQEKAWDLSKVKKGSMQLFRQWINRDPANMLGFFDHTAFQLRKSIPKTSKGRDQKDVQQEKDAMLLVASVLIITRYEPETGLTEANFNDHKTGITVGLIGVFDVESRSLRLDSGNTFTYVFEGDANRPTHVSIHGILMDYQPAPPVKETKSGKKTAPQVPKLRFEIKAYVQRALHPVSELINLRLSYTGPFVPTEDSRSRLTSMRVNQVPDAPAYKLHARSTKEMEGANASNGSSSSSSASSATSSAAGRKVLKVTANNRLKIVPKTTTSLAARHADTTSLSLIFRMLTEAEFISAHQTCRLWFEAARSRTMWHYESFSDPQSELLTIKGHRVVKRGSESVASAQPSLPPGEKYLLLCTRVLKVEQIPNVVYFRQLSVLQLHSNGRLILNDNSLVEKVMTHLSHTLRVLSISGMLEAVGAHFFNQLTKLKLLEMFEFDRKDAIRVNGISKAELLVEALLQMPTLRYIALGPVDGNQQVSTISSSDLTAFHRLNALPNLEHLRFLDDIAAQLLVPYRPESGPVVAPRLKKLADRMAQLESALGWMDPNGSSTRNVSSSSSSSVGSLDSSENNGDASDPAKSTSMRFVRTHVLSVRQSTLRLTSKVLEHFPSLTNLCLNFMDAPTGDISDPARFRWPEATCQKLRQLDVSVPRPISFLPYLSIVGASNVTSLHLHGTPSEDDRGQEFFAKLFQSMPNLTSLNLQGVCFTCTSLEIFTSIPNLKHLDGFPLPRNLKDRSRYHSLEGIFPSLETLRVQETEPRKAHTIQWVTRELPFSEYYSILLTIPKLVTVEWYLFPVMTPSQFKRYFEHRSEHALKGNGDHLSNYGCTCPNPALVLPSFKSSYRSEPPTSNQPRFRCVMCSSRMAGARAMCTVCAKLCHVGHEIEEIAPGMAFCDCSGTGCKQVHSNVGLFHGLQTKGKRQGFVADQAAEASTSSRIIEPCQIIDANLLSLNTSAAAATALGLIGKPKRGSDTLDAEAQASELLQLSTTAMSAPSSAAVPFVVKPTNIPKPGRTKIIDFTQQEDEDDMLASILAKLASS